MRDETHYPLKAKYRLPSRLLHRDKIDPPEGTLVYNAGRNHSKPSGNVGAKGKVFTVRPRMKVYWGNVAKGVS